MYRAVSAGWFFLLIAAAVQAHVGIFAEFRAIGAQAVLIFIGVPAYIMMDMMVAAI